MAHLKAPVTEVGVAGHIIAKEAEQAAERVADHGSAQVADMHGLGDIRSAKVDHDLFGLLEPSAASLLVTADHIGVR